MKRIKEATLQKNRDWLELVIELAVNRAKMRCEKCKKKYYHIGAFGLIGHHIIRRSRGRIDSPENALILCLVCHKRADNPTMEMRIDGVQYPPFTLEEQFELVKKQNEN